MNNKRNKWLAGIFIFLGVVIALVAGVLIYLDINAKNIAESRINKQLEKNGLPLTFSSDKLELDIFAGKIRGSNLQLSIDSSALTDGPAASLYAVTLDSLYLKGFQWFTLIFSGNIKMDTLGLSGLRVDIYQAGEQKQKDTTSKNNKRKERSLDLDGFGLKNAQVNLHKNGQTNKVKVALLHRAGLGKADLSQPLKALITSVWNVKDAQFFPASGLYKWEITSLNIRQHEKGRKGEGALLADSIRLVPLKSEDDFSEVINYEKDRMIIKSAGVEISRITWEKLANKTPFLKAGHIKLKPTDLFIYKDKRLPFPPNQQKVLPTTFLRDSLPVQIEVDTLTVSSSLIVYEEMVKGVEKPGHIEFNEVNIQIGPLLNADSLWGTGKEMACTAEALLMGSGKLTLTMGYPMVKEGAPFWLKGNLGQMDLTQLNPVTEPLAKARIKEGKLNSLDFSIEATRERATGEAKPRYENLMIELIDPDGSEPIKGTLLTFIANSAAIRNQNPRENEVLVIGEISQERDPQRSVINYWWKSLLSGLKPAIGLGGEKEKVKLNEKN